MANYYATARSNYFRVKHEEDFKDWLDTTNMELLNEKWDDNGYTVFSICPTAPDSEGWSLTLWEDEEGVELDKERDQFRELSEHLEDGWVAILMEAGAEKLRYVTGFALAINNKGENECLDLNGIYTRAERLGAHITTAEY